MLKPPRDDYFTAEQANQLQIELLAGCDVPENLPRSITHTLAIIDTGCGRSMGNHTDHFEPESLYDCKSPIDGASGAFVAKQRGNLRWPMESNRGMRMWREPESVFNRRCAYLLLSGGRASIREGMTMWLPGWGADGVLTWPNGVKVRVLNKYVTILRPLGYKLHPEAALASVTVDDLGVPADGDYIIYLGSGRRRDGDVPSQVDEMGVNVSVVLVDPKLRGVLNDLTKRPVALALVKAGSDPRCRMLLSSTRCCTWTVSHLLPDKHGNPGKPRRDQNHVLGFTQGGRLPDVVAEGNTEAEHAVEIAYAVVSHDGAVMAEAPARRTGPLAKPRH
eukprot:7379509-Prymnesium_polylepis.1